MPSERATGHASEKARTWIIAKRTGEWDDVIEGPNTDSEVVVALRDVVEALRDVVALTGGADDFIERYFTGQGS
jgi:hypothetical protein